MQKTIKDKVCNICTTVYLMSFLFFAMALFIMIMAIIVSIVYPNIFPFLLSGESMKFLCFFVSISFLVICFMTKYRDKFLK